MKSTNYYNENASKYIADTIDADMSPVRKRFLSHLPRPWGRCHKVTEGGEDRVVTILDAGCGSGRDVKAFKEFGFEVYAIDASEKFVEHCRLIIGGNVKLAAFQDYTTDIKFDGIWACASLLHLTPEELPGVLLKFTGFLKPGGVFFMSFKYGNKNYIKDNRYFNCHTSESVTGLLRDIKDIEILENFVTNDVREGRSEEKWVNVIVRKIPPAGTPTPLDKARGLREQ
jgi:SAM-dependent methyltransferase